MPDQELEILLHIRRNLKEVSGGWQYVEPERLSPEWGYAFVMKQDDFNDKVKTYLNERNYMITFPGWPQINVR